MINVGPPFCLDTSALIESWHRHYPVDRFPSLWNLLDDAIANGKIIAPKLVLEELSRQDDELHQWAKARKTMFQPMEANMQFAQTEIINTFPRFVSPDSLRSLADPWVIALAHLRRCPVVSMEKPGSKNKPRIPDVCKHYKIHCMEMIGLIRALNWSF